MPLAVDENGWPTAEAVIAKINTVTPAADLDQAAQDDIPFALAAAIADFEGPTSNNEDGGTGRTFTPTTETRVFDGNGMPTLRVPDIATASGLVVMNYDTVLVNVVLKTNYRGLGYNVLAWPNDALYGGIYANFSGLFPRGQQNISVTATWGYALLVPIDIADAVACEAAYRTLVQNVGNISGVTSSVKTDTTTVTQTGGPLDFATSALTTWHKRYTSKVRQYRDSGTWRLQNIARQLS